MANTKKGVEMSQAQGELIYDLQDELKGEVIVPEDPGDDEARQGLQGLRPEAGGGCTGRGAEDVARVATVRARAASSSPFAAAATARRLRHQRGRDRDRPLGDEGA